MRRRCLARFICGQIALEFNFELISELQTLIGIAKHLCKCLNNNFTDEFLEFVNTQV